MTEETPTGDFSESGIKTHNEECEKEIDLCHKTINEEQAEYDKQLLTLATGFLGVVVAFVKDVVPLKVAVWLCLFYGSLAGFILCILTVLFSYQFSIRGHFKAKEFWENKRPGDDNSKYPFSMAKLIRGINWFSGSFFFLAIVFLGIFIIKNVSEERNMPENSEPLKVMVVHEGANLRTPLPTQLPNDFNRGAHIKVPAQPQSAPATQNQQSNTGSTNGNTGQSDRK